MVWTGLLGPGDFSEKNFYCASSTTLLCMETTEVFGLEADDLCNLTERFQYKFATQSFKRTARARGRPAATQEMEYGDSNERILRQCAAMFSSLRPHDHLD
ncbi:hypothetical protein MKW92_017223 [Papaver armeniacum]|nr:hypothetical protein MKW92_017223 [Papaver armeniacum]